MSFDVTFDPSLNRIQGHTTAPNTPVLLADASLLGDSNTPLTAPDHKEDAYQNLGTSGPDGSFDLVIPQPPRPGDKIAVSAGTDTVWVTAPGTDTENAIFRPRRIQLTYQTNGTFKLSNARIGDLLKDKKYFPISEPFAKLQFINQRTNEATIITLDDSGNFPADASIPGQPNDKFSVAISDGTNNTDFATISDERQGFGVTNDVIADPDPDYQHPNADKRSFDGPLEVSGVSFDDVEQGQLGDCFVPAALSAMAEICPKELLSRINMTLDASGRAEYSITLFKRETWGGPLKPTIVKLDSDLFVNSDGTPLYVSSVVSPRDGGASQVPGTMELWPSLDEKAYAILEGGYNSIGSGGGASDVFEAFLGVPAKQESITDVKPDDVWNFLTTNAGKWPICAGTFGDDQEALYKDTNIYADHCYTLLGTEVSSTGERMVKLRNPWSNTEPGNDGTDDGIFEIPLTQFMTLYQTLYFAPLKAPAPGKV